MKSHILQRYLFCSTANHARKSCVQQEQFYQPADAGNPGLYFLTRFWICKLWPYKCCKILALYSTLHLTSVTFIWCVHLLQVKSIKLRFKLFSSSASQKIAEWWLPHFTSDQSECQASHLSSLLYTGLSLHVILKGMCPNKTRDITSVSSYRASEALGLHKTVIEKAQGSITFLSVFYPLKQWK